MITNRSELSPREFEQMQHEKEMFEKQSVHAKAIKELEVEALKIESKWSSWLKVPVTIVKLPITAILAVAVVVYAIRGIEPPENIRELLK